MNLNVCRKVVVRQAGAEREGSMEAWSECLQGLRCAASDMLGCLLQERESGHRSMQQANLWRGNKTANHHSIKQASTQVAVVLL